jgi:DNA-binding transcriptional regulator YiaG
MFMPKQKGTDPVSDTVMIGDQEFTTVQGAQRILTELVGGKRNYSRFTVYRMLTNYKVEVIRTPSANYYSVEGLRNLKDKLHPERGTHTNTKHYSAEKKEQASQLHKEGLSNREISRRLNVSYQTINNWTKKAKTSEEAA